jgi:YbbR domain-containing protein
MEKLVKQILGTGQENISRSWAKNWLLKLLSLCFALFLWYFVVGEDKVDMTVNIPIEIVNLPRDLMISNQVKRQLEVTVSGPRGLIRGITGQHITRSVDLSSATPGTVVVRNEPDSVPFPRGVKVLRIQPTHIIFLLDRLIQKDLVVNPIIEKEPPGNYEVASIQLEPPTITITGPQAVLAGVDILLTRPIDVSGLTGSVIRQVSLDLKPDLADLIGEPVVTARINIREKTVERRVTGLPVEVNGSDPSRKHKITPPTVSVRAELPVGLVKNTTDLKSLFLTKINLEGMAPGTHKVPVKINATQEVRILEVSPETVTVTIQAPAE